MFNSEYSLSENDNIMFDCGFKSITIQLSKYANSAAKFRNITVLPVPRKPVIKYVIIEGLLEVKASITLLYSSVLLIIFVGDFPYIKENGLFIKTSLVIVIIYLYVYLCKFMYICVYLKTIVYVCVYSQK